MIKDTGIEKQMDLYRKEIEAIDQEIKRVEDGEKKKALPKEKKHLAEKVGRVISTSSPFKSK